jgi:hypothetical protein
MAKEQEEIFGQDYPKLPMKNAGTSDSSTWRTAVLIS